MSLKDLRNDLAYINAISDLMDTFRSWEEDIRVAALHGSVYVSAILSKIQTQRIVNLKFATGLFEKKHGVKLTQTDDKFIVEGDFDLKEYNQRTVEFIIQRLAMARSCIASGGDPSPFLNLIEDLLTGEKTLSGKFKLEE